MPLVQSSSDAAWEKNLKTELASGRPRDQSLAIAYETQRRNRHATGGGIGGPSVTTSFARGGGIGASQDPPVIYDQMHIGGIIHGATGGRTDRLPLSVGAGSHVMTADYISGIGQGDSRTGESVFLRALRIGPHGVPVPRTDRGPGPPHAPRLPRRGFAEGGDPQTSILAASGEFIVPLEDWVAVDPDDGQPYLHRGVRSLGGGDENAGHDALDRSMKNVRDFNIDFLRTAAPPKK